MLCDWDGNVAERNTQGLGYFITNLLSRLWTDCWCLETWVSSDPTDHDLTLLKTSVDAMTISLTLFYCCW